MEMNRDHTMCSDYKRTKLELNNGKLFRKSQNIWKLNNTILNKRESMRESQREVKKFFLS